MVGLLGLSANDLQKRTKVRWSLEKFSKLLVHLPSPFFPPFLAIHLFVKNGSSKIFNSAGSSDEGFLRFDVNNFTGLVILFTILEIVFTGEDTWSFKDFLGGGVTDSSGDSDS